jgi:L-ascorbate metabolism protein UlaG (beta-lactamase superfamily)
MTFTYYGHSCFSVNIGNMVLLFDPFIKSNELAVKAGVDVKKIPADYILLSHGHYDHCEDAAAIAKRTGATVIAGFEVSEWIKKQGVKNVQGMNHGGAATHPFGRIKFVNAVHSSTMPDGTPGGNAGGFVVETLAGSFYYSGDTALTLDMQLVKKAAKLDFAVLCIGDHFTMGVDDAIQAAGWVGAKNVVGVHYDTFPPIVLDRPAATKKFKKAGLKLHLPAINSTIRL